MFDSYLIARELYQFHFYIKNEKMGFITAEFLSFEITYNSCRIFSVAFCNFVISEDSSVQQIIKGLLSHLQKHQQGSTAIKLYKKKFRNQRNALVWKKEGKKANKKKEYFTQDSKEVWPILDRSSKLISCHCSGVFRIIGHAKRQTVQTAEPEILLWRYI